MTNRFPWLKTFRFGKPLMVLTFSLLYTVIGFSQTNWRTMDNNKSATFYDVQKDFQQFWDGKKVGKGQGYKVYKRWENFMTPRVYPSGNMLLPSNTYANFMAWKQQHKSSSNSPSGNWTALGPLSKPLGYDAGVGRIDFVRFDPTNTDIMYVGAPDGGLWKTSNGGTSWSTNTDFLTVIGCSDLAIDPTNTQVMYLATGNWESDRRSIGILKSIDGGDTWNTTSLSWTALDNYKIRKLLMDPNDPSIMMVATDGGVFRTTDAWATNTNTYCCSGLYDMEFKPGNSNTVYAAGTEFLVSTDNGVNWTQITDGLPDPTDVSRMVLGVTAADNGYVYALAGDSDDGFLGLYLSTDSGTSFFTQSTTPNILNSSKDGSGTGGQASHDLAIAVSPVDEALVTIGGINQWRSTDGGVNWTLLSYWLGDDVNYPGEGDGPPDYIHADIQDITYMPGSSSTMFTTCDGGIFKSVNNGLNWTDISNNLSVGQQTGIALSASDPGIMVTGLQDIGTLKADAGIWTVINGGDGEDAFIDRSSNLIMVTSNPAGAHAISFDGGTNYDNITGLPADAQWFSPISQDPGNIDLVYAGGRPALWSTEELFSVGGDCDWNELGIPPGSDNIIQFMVAPSNTDIIYAIKIDAVSISTDAGSSWNDVTGQLPVGDVALTDVFVSDTDPDKVWVTFSGYNDGDKVFKTIDGGSTWTNISSGLPNLPINSIIAVNGSAIDAVYIGADIGVYYKDNNLPDFVAFFTNMPNVAVTDLEIYYPSNLLRASTYGRGSWESDMYEASTVTCPGNSVVCLDASAFDLTGGEPAGGTYSGAGVNAGMFEPATAGVGDHTITYTNVSSCTYTITVNALPVVTCGSNLSVCLDEVSFDLSGASPAGGDYSGQGVSAGAFDPAAAGVGTHTISYDFIDGNSCANSCSYTITVNALPMVSCGSDMSVCEGSGAFDLDTASPAGGTYSGTGVNAGMFDPAGAGVGTHTVSYDYSDANACASSCSFMITVNATPTVTCGSDISVCEGSAAIDLDNASPAGGTYSGPGVNAGMFDPAAAGVGTHTISYDYSDVNACANSCSFMITVNATPTVTCGSDITVCEGSSAFDLGGGSPAGGTYSGAGVNGTVFDPAAAGVGTHTISYDYTDVNACSNSCSFMITVDAAPMVTCGSDVTVCAGSAAFDLSGGSPAGGTYSGPGVSGTIFDPAVAGVGAHTISYEFTDANACSNSCDYSITVSPLPAVSCLGDFSIHIDDAAFVLNGGMPAGGTYSGAGVTNGMFDPTAAGLGAHVITYFFTDANNCSNTCDFTITVSSNPTVTCGPNVAVCLDAPAFMLTGATPAGGAYTGPGVSADMFDPAVAGAGMHTITYTNGGSCTYTITVNALPVVDCGSGDVTVCMDEPAFDLSSGSPAGGTYSGTGVSADMFDAATAGVGAHIITYDYTDANNCANACTYTITVNMLPTVTCASNTFVCIDAPSFDLDGGSPIGGNYNGNGVSGVTFDPAAAGAGAHIITYDYTDLNGCSNACTYTITVNPLPTLTCAGNASVNINDPAFALTGSLPVGGNYSGSAVIGGMFAPNAAGAGVHDITYSFTDGNGCSNSCTFTITVNDLPTVTCGPNSATCIDAPAIMLTGGTPTGGTYSGSGVSTGLFDPADAGTGIHTITYTNGGSCTFTITVNDLPTLTCPSNSTLCIDTAPFDLTESTPAGGTYSGTGVNAGLFDASAAGIGTHSISYDYIDANACANSCDFTITVNDLPPAPTCPANASVSVGAPAFNLSGGVPVGGIYSGGGVSMGIFDPAVAGVGMHLITYTFSDVNNCNNTCTYTLTVDSLSSLFLLQKEKLLISAVPNPTNGLLWINVSLTDAADSQISVMNTLGQTLLQRNMQLSAGNNQFDIDLTNLPSGIYQVYITANEKRGMVKVIKE